MAVALGHLGLVLLVVGAVVVLAGLVVIALAGRHKQRRCAMDPRRCSTPCRDSGSLLALTAEPRGPAVPERHDRARRARPVRLPGHSVLDAITYDMITLSVLQLVIRPGLVVRNATLRATWVPGDGYKLVVTVSTQQSI